MNDNDQRILEQAVRARRTDPQPEWWPVEIMQVVGRVLLDQEQRIKALETNTPFEEMSF